MNGACALGVSNGVLPISGGEVVVIITLTTLELVVSSAAGQVI